MEKHGYSGVYRVTDYNHPFDEYKGQNILLFDEFCGQFKIQEMLNYLDGYPLTLPARYANKQACYTSVYIISNIDLSEQYANVQQAKSRVRAAFPRRIDKVIYFSGDGQTEYGTDKCLSDLPF